MIETFDSLEDFYAADSKRRHSGEVDYGVHWTEAGVYPQWRVSFIEETGEVYAVRFGRLDHHGPHSVEVLTRFDDREACDRALEGWPDQCGPGGLEWVRARCR